MRRPGRKRAMAERVAYRAPRRAAHPSTSFELTLRLAPCIDKKRSRDRVFSRNDILKRGVHILGVLVRRDGQRLVVRADIAHPVVADRPGVLVDLVGDRLARGQKKRRRGKLLSGP